MPFIQYPASRAAIDRVQNFDDNQILAFNNIMKEVQTANALGSTSLEVSQVEAFAFYGLGALFIAQGYTVVPFGTAPVLMYTISWS